MLSSFYQSVLTLLFGNTFWQMRRFWCLAQICICRNPEKDSMCCQSVCLSVATCLSVCCYLSVYVCLRLPVCLSVWNGSQCNVLWWLLALGAQEIQFYNIPLNDTSFELSVFWPSDTESRINELRFSESVSLSFKTRLVLVICFYGDFM